MPHHKSHFSNVNVFTPLWRAVKTSGRARSGQEDRLQKIIKSEKKSKTLKMHIFVQYLTLQIVLAERKAGLITVFPQLLKIMSKKGLVLSKVRREKPLAQTFRKYLTERKLEIIRIKIMLSASPSLFFHTKFTISALKSKYIFQCRSPQLGFQAFMIPLILSTNFIKQ